MTSTHGDQLFSENVTTEILARIRVKSLMRFRCVCKHWNTLLKSFVFAEKHLNHKSNSSLLLVKHYNYNIEKFALALFPNENLTDAPPIYHDLENSQTLVYPEVIVGTNSGILCMYCRYEGERLALWNPATKQFKDLSVPQADLPANVQPFMFNFGFGLDIVSNNYKLIMIRLYYNHETDCPYHPRVIAVYTLGVDSWRVFEVDVPPTRCILNSLGDTYTKGFYYWLTSTNVKDYKVLLCDLDNESFVEIPGPPDIPESKWADIAMLGESVCMILFCPQDVDKSFDVWLMQEHGCWNKQFAMGPLANVQRPVGIWKNGELLLETPTSQLVLYNSSTQEFKNLGPSGQKYCLKTHSYRESLLSVKAANERQNGDQSLDMDQLRDFFTFHSLEGGQEKS